jgi:hypothetical protein
MAKLWRSTPAHMPWDIRISGLDMLQARTLARTARKLEAQGRPSEAATAWFTAIANHPGDVSLHENLLHLVLDQKKPDGRSRSLGVGSANWLLQLSGTNSRTLPLAAAMLSTAGLHDEVWNLLNSAGIPVTYPTDRILAITAFETDRFDLFSKIYLRNETAFLKDPELKLYHDAWSVLWGPVIDSVPAMEAIHKAIRSENQAALALRLKLLIHSHRIDIAAFNETFKILKAMDEARVQDHIRYWLFHENLGDHDRAVQAARAADLKAFSALEASAMLNAWAQLGLSDLLSAFAGHQLPNFSSSYRLHIQVANGLLVAKRWEDIRLLAAMMKANRRLGSSFSAYADFLEGRAALGLDQPKLARECFLKVLSRPPKDGALSFQIAKSWVELGYADEAVQLLELLEPALNSSKDYWILSCAAANLAHRETLLLKAARRALDFSPHDTSLLLNYGFALSACRKKPTEAVATTWECLSHVPNSLTAQLSHALALSLNGRYNDALRRLQDTPIEGIPVELHSQWWFCKLESSLGLQQSPAARFALAALDRSSLFPSQRDWLNQIRSQLEASGSGR